MKFQPTLTTGPLWDELLAGLSRREFSVRSRVPRESLSRWAKGEGRPSKGSIAQIALRLGRDPDEVGRLLLAIYQDACARRDHASTAASGG